MNEKEHQFAELKKLLQLKHHEVPPPAYFNNFSDQVISRIRAGEARSSRTLADRLQSEAPWLANFIQIFETRPGLIGAAATSLCLLLGLVVLFADRPDGASKNLLSATEPAAASTSSSVASLSEPSLLAASDSSGIVASTNPVTSLQPTTTLFGQASSSQLFQPAGFLTAGSH